MDEREPAYILALGLSHWANKPEPKNAEERIAAADVYLSVIERCLSSHGLAIVRIGVLEEIESEHKK